tara:strand:- start:34973 stop:35863 length:891 start_codon:yes stop_codon:yes gene_type:complete
MKGLASLAMRGRFHALLLTVACAGSLLFCWISAALVALVTLRKGASQGAWLMLWALLPAGTLLYVFGDSGPITLLAGTLILALVLRVTVSLPLTMLAAVAVGFLTGLALVAFGGSALDQMVAYLGEFLSSLEQELGKNGQEVVLARPTAVQVAGMLGAGNAMMSVMCLLLARYWQAALYNPGGFASEFRQLRLTPVISAVLAVVAVALFSLGVQYRTWALISLLPLTFAGLSLVHARAASRGQGSGWLAVFYVAWVLFDPVKLLLVIAAIADSWLDFRQRWASGSGTDVRRHDDED